ncbi:hypothetical protein P152DRAFT_466303 [Eremomyces bilateralis CBS 781.70]|uniref:Uncharacterized protein n=1 Tax=Eremomyces bilateralis CBS 781.70 TaxID=1392243 RepID=A0A6G1G4L5_9PEZI|nr:uncharacterized protein P152DRAFT_466303 [Eremomyces bilateralis CBS 781.70]KAF1813003.1 hypothetical protein P152DRAFT_466303 [Eremomyces bilateralis CBS 781.70]
MPSHLRRQQSFEPFTAETTRSYFSPSPPAKKQKKMSLTQTYYIAASARSKLGREAQKSDHSLRHLVGHANLLDSLMVELHEAEREQETWFNQTIQKAEEPMHVRWADSAIMEEDEDDSASDASDSDSDDDFDEADFELTAPLHFRQSAISITSREVEDSDEEFEDEEDDEEHALTRTASNSPPELILDSDSDDDTPPASPPQLSLEYTEEQRQAIATTGFFNRKQSSLSPSEQESFVEEGFFIPDRSNQLIAAC